MAISDIRKLEQQGYADYTSQDEDFFQRVDPSFEGYKNYGVVADKRNAVADAVQQAGGYYEAPDTSEKDLATLGTLGTAAINYGKWEPYASSLLKKGFPKASFSTATQTTVDGITTTTYGTGANVASTPIGAAASKYYSNLTAGQATTSAIGTGVGTALVGYGIKKVFGDDDPTTYTAAEQIGTGVQAVGTAATIANVAGIALGPVGLAAAAFLGWRSGKRKQRKAIQAAKEQRQIDIEQAYLENKVDYGEMAKQEEYLKNRAMFENTYAMDQTDPNQFIPSYPNGGTIGTGGGPSGFGGYGGSPYTTSTGTQPNSMGSVGAGYVPFQSFNNPSNPIAGSYAGFINGLIGMQGPLVNKGRFVGGASQRSVVLENQGAQGSAGNFLQRQEGTKNNFYKTAEKGMKVAEVTGNEVIMPAERQNKIEKALASGDTETPGKIMKQTLSENKVTKGAASHDSNPMPIMSSGAVLDKNGNDTGLKANDGAGIYHQASKQFKKNMSNKQLSKAIAKNIASWKKQGKA